MATIVTRSGKGAALTHTEVDANFTNLNADKAEVSAVILATQKGAASGVAPLDAASKISSTYLPSYVDDVLEYANYAALPATGETGKIYVALDTNKTYRWSGSAYVYITSGAVDSVAGKTGVVTLVKADVGLSNVDNTTDALKPISTATQTALDLKSPIASPTFTGTTTAANLAYTGTLTGSTAILNIGSGQLYKDASGNVGIGTSSPTSSTGYGTLTVNGTTGGQIAFNTAGTNKHAIYSTATDLGILNTVAGNIIFSTTYTERMRIDSSGKVGINVTPSASTSAKLQVTGSTTNATTLATSYSNAAVAYVPKSSSGYSLAIASGTGDFPQLQVSANGAASGDLLIQPYGGNVGIGVTPAVKLDVGSPNTNSIIRVGDYTANATSAYPLIEAFGSRQDANATFYGRFGASKRRSDGTAIASGQAVGVYAFGGQWGTDTSYQSAKHLYAASITGVSESSFTSATTMSTAIVFNTGSTGGLLSTYNTAYGTERMRIDSSGNVGIGTSSPGAKLDVSGGRSFFAASSEPFAVGARYSAAGGTVYFGATDATATPGVQISAATGSPLLNITTSGNVGIGTSSPSGKTHIYTTAAAGAVNQASSALNIENTPGDPMMILTGAYGGIIASMTSAQAATPMRFYTGTAERMRIDSSGNVGIGTSSPGAKLDVVGGIKMSGQLITGASGSVYSPIVSAGYVSGTSNLYLRNLSGINRIDSYNDPITATYPLAINASVMSFNIADSEKMRIDSSGNLLVGTTVQLIAPSKLTVRADTGSFGQFIQCSISGGAAFAINNTGATYLQYFYNNGSVVGSITNNTTNTFYNTSSDKRLKTNIKPAGVATQSILDLPIFQFDWLIDNSHQDFGGVAQDILPIIPEMVHVPTDETQMMSVDWSKAVPRLIKTIQELNARLTALENK